MALNATWNALTARVRGIRRIAFAALALFAIVLLSAAFARSFWFLWGLIALPWLGFAHYRGERRIVDAWENLLLDLWVVDNLYLLVVQKTLAVQHTPYKRSLNGMLALLPPEEKTRSPSPAFIGSCRAAAAARQVAESRRWARGLMLHSAGYASAFAAVLGYAVGLRAGLFAAAALWAVIAALGAVHFGLDLRWLRSRARLISTETPWDAAGLDEALRQGAGASLPRAFRRILA